MVGLLKGPNKVACEFLGCDLASKQKNITPAIVLSVLLDVVIPLIMTLMMINVLLSLPASAIISALFSLSFLITFMVILGGNVIFLIIAGIIALIISIILFYLFYLQVGLYALIPLAMYGLGFLLQFIPIIGGLLHLITRLIPWVIVSMVIYWIENADAGLKVEPLFKKD